MSRAFALAIITAVGTAFASGQAAPPGGAPPPGSGPFSFYGFVRVIEGDTVEIRLSGNQVGIGFIGITSPMGNTPCGQESISALMALVGGGLRVEEDAGMGFDERGRRLYYGFTLDGRSLAAEMVRRGFARVSNRGREAAQLAILEAQARGARAGCLWGPPGRPSPNGGSDPEPTAASTRKAGPLHASAEITALAPNLTTGFAEEVVAGGFSQPTAFTFLPDGRILVTQKHGEVRLVKNGVLQTTLVIDLSPRVNDYWDHGLLGIAADPSFATNGYIYLLYTYENDPNQYNGTKTARLARYTMVGDTASVASEFILLGKSVGSSCSQFPAGADCLPSESPSHSIGNLKFASDGTLFVSTGDGAHFNYVDVRALRSLDNDSLAGKILRITTTGDGLTTNPFYAEVSGAVANRAKVWSSGLRNPYRFNLRPGTLTPYIGDVGWNTWEEVNTGPPGANYGWPCYEGAYVQSGYQAYAECQALYAQGVAAVRPPFYAWSHNVGNCSTGGTFLAGGSFPSPYRDAYYFGDYVKGFIRQVAVDASGSRIGEPADFVVAGDGPVAIEAGPDGSLYYLAIKVSQLRRVRYTASNMTPVASATANPASGPAPLTVQFSSAGSHDPDGDPITHTWRFGDGTSESAEANPAHTYTSPGTYSAVLTVSDGRGGSATATVGISAGNTAPRATITSPSPTLLFRVGDTITYSGSGTDAQDGTLPAANLSWHGIVHHCPDSICHTHTLFTATGTGGTFVAPDHEDDSHLELRLTAKDSGGLTDSVGTLLQPQKVRLTLRTAPEGLQLTYSGRPVSSPFTQLAVVGGRRTIGAPPLQDSYRFAYWSDNESVDHAITVGSTDTTYTAYFGPPIIKDVASEVTGRVRITWSTHLRSDTQVEYGLTTAYGSVSRLDPVLVTAHNVNLNGLARSRTYHYRVRSRDQNGLLSVSPNYTFTTR